MEQQKKNPFQDTLNLPKTEFSIRANASVKEQELLDRWQKDGTHEAASDAHSSPTIKDNAFILHDGPPYANGHIHLGHALNKILKDMSIKAQRMQGRYAPFVPGWDCHGLPIEIKVAKEQGIAMHEASEEVRTSLKKSCRAYAAQWIDVQRKEFKNLGVLADWSKPYTTMSFGYEASILRSFASFVDQGYIERKGKTVPWCFSCQTVLATAEIEYKDRKDPSCFILFDLLDADIALQFPFLVEQKPGISVGLLIWTTTPWTIPLNRAVVLHPDEQYLVLEGKDKDQAFIVGKQVAAAVCKQMGIPLVELCEFDAEVLKGKKVKHPIVDGLTVPVTLDHTVITTDGTACLHSAPGCGPEDYFLGIKHGLEIFSPLSADGRYTKGIMPVELEGMKITDGQGWVLKTLIEKGKLLHKSSIEHSYPHCWRCRNGLMFRATDQWFCDLSKNNLAQQARQEIQDLAFIPAWGKSRLESFIERRTEWCISRQRVWGVPITALLCINCSKPYLTKQLIDAVADAVETQGIEFWDSVTVDELKQINAVPQSLQCSCGCSTFKKEYDILDVWFDSGVSHTAVLMSDKRLRFPADVYFEGSDQHRGWFQSSLLTSMILHGTSCTKTIVTHGFLVDKNRHKMSKSLGNGVEPGDIIKQHSRDILRLWIASTDFEGDVVFSDALLQNVAEVYRKIRNTCRFMLANLYDFNVNTTDRVSEQQLLAIDHFILSKLSLFCQAVIDAYNRYDFSRAVKEINNFCVNDLSGFYLDVAKDRLYVEAPTSISRRAAQTTLFEILHLVTHLMAPVLSFLAEEISDYYLTGKKQSIHLHTFPHVQLREMPKEWQLLEALRNAVLKKIEEQRQAGIVKHSLEAQVFVAFDTSKESANICLDFMKEIFKNSNENTASFLKDLLIVSSVKIATNNQRCEPSEGEWFTIKVEHADGSKCPRCWQWEETERTDLLCSRCAMIVCQ